MQDRPYTRLPVTRQHCAAVLALLAIQFSLQAYFFPLGELFSTTPLLHIDGAFHAYQIEVANALCAGHQLVGLDPFFGAGTLGGVTFNASAKLPALLSCVAGLPPATAYKLFSFWMGVLAPSALVVACTLLGLSAKATWIAALLALLSWWTGPVRWYHTAGLVSYIAAAYWVIPFAIGAIQLCRNAPLARWWLLALVAAGALGLLLHPLFPVAVGLIAAPAVGLVWRDAGAIQRSLLVAAAVLAGMLLLNGPWLLASFGAPSFATLPQPYQRQVDPWLLLREPLGLASTASGGSRLYLALLIGTALGLTAGRRTGGAVLQCLAASAVLLMAWASVGAVVPAIGALQPNRFSVLAWLVLIPSAAHGLATATDHLRDRTNRLRLVHGAGLAASVLVLVFYGRETELEVFSSKAARYGVSRPEVKPAGALSAQIAQFLRTQTNGTGRVFFETSLGRVHDDAHLAGLYALGARREFIGGPYPFTDFASAWDGFAFGRPLVDIPTVELVSLLDAYNIRWLLCHSDTCRTAVSRLPQVKQLATLGPVTAYGRTTAGDFAFTGRATVVARCVNRVDIHSDAGPVLVLKYHWVPGLISTPAAVLSPRLVVPGARPFVAIDHPPADFSLSVGPAPPACPAQLP